MTKQVCTIGASKVTSGSLTWGIRTSFTSYLRGPIANGSWKLSGGANWNGSAFTFPLTSAHSILLPNLDLLSTPARFT
ncbi:hypothetical membrane protein [Cutibacterium acnes JCM 18916]|nr:hypothetical membrane protein [Cutibacterium acnes JCM 18916]